MRRHPAQTLRRRDSGSALTEFVIIVPCFILLLYWAEFISDLSLVKMKVEEAARFALWDLAAMQTPTNVTNDVQTQFRDLGLPGSIFSSSPLSFFSFKDAVIGNPAMTTNGQAPINAGNVVNWGGNGGGLINQILRGLAGFINSSVDGLVQNFAYTTNRVAQAQVTITVTNNLFPAGGGVKLGTTAGPDANSTPILLNSDGNDTIQVKATSPAMLIDTWKAWPSPYAMYSTVTSVTPYQTYGQGSVPENEVSARLKHLAFFGIQNTGFGGVVQAVFTLAGFPDPFSTATWAGSTNGPIAMLPGDTPKHGGVPGSGVGSQRLGNNTYPQSTAPVLVGSNIDNPPNIDRARSTVPSYIHTGFWSNTGGMSGTPTLVRFTNVTNPYMAEYACRDIYYLGAVTPGITRYNNPNANKQAFPGCP